MQDFHENKLDPHFKENDKACYLTNKCEIENSSFCSWGKECTIQAKWKPKSYVRVKEQAFQLRNIVFVPHILNKNFDLFLLENIFIFCASKLCDKCLWIFIYKDPVKVENFHVYLSLIVAFFSLILGFQFDFIKISRVSVKVCLHCNTLRFNFLCFFYFLWFICIYTSFQL